MPRYESQKYKFSFDTKGAKTPAVSFKFPFQFTGIHLYQA